MKQKFSRWLPAWLALLLFGVGTITAPADIWRKLNTGSGPDGRVQYNEVDDGMLLVFQNAVTPDTTFYLTNGPTTIGNGASEMSVAPPTEQGNINQVFQVEWVSRRSGTAGVSGYVGDNVFYLKSYQTGLYVTTQALLSSGAPILSDYLMFTDDKTKAMEFCFANAGSGTYGRNALSRGGKAADIWGDGSYSEYDAATYRTTVAIAYNPDRGQLSGRYTSIEADLNVFVGNGPQHNQIIQLNPWGGTRPWFVYNVEIVTGKQILSALLDQYTANGDTPAVYQGGTAPGYYDATAAASFASAWASIQQAIADTESPSDAAIEQMQTDLRNALAAVRTTQVGISDGYYAVVSADSALTTTAALTGGTQLDAATGLTRADYSADNAQQLFRITAADHGYYVQNAGTGYYVNRPGSLTNSLEAATVQTFTKLAAAGQFAIGNSAATSQYYAATATGLSSSATAAINSETAWRLQPVDSTTAARLIAASEPLRTQLTLQRLISEAQDRVSATDTVVTFIEPYVTEPSQLSTNSPEVLDNTGIENLIDGNTTSYFHSRWSPYAEGEARPTEPDYICAKIDDGIGGDIGFSFVPSPNRNFPNNYPTKALITVSHDSVTWDTVATVNIPIIAQTATYNSRIFTLDDDYTYIKFSVLETPNGHSSNGQTTMQYAEFNWYEAEVSQTRSASLRADTREQLAALKAAIATAQAVSNPTEADVATLQAALDNFNAVYPETGELEAEILAAQAQHDAAPIQNGVSGYYNTNDADALQTAINTAAAGDIGALSKSDIDGRYQALKDAEYKFKWSYNVADSNKIYRVHFITNNAARTPAGYLYIVDDRYNTAKGFNVNADWSEDVRDDAEDAYYFTVKQVGDTVWVLQHVKTGYYVWNPITHSIRNGYSVTTSTNRDESHYVFHAVGDGTFIILPEGYNRYWLTKELAGTHYNTSTNLLAQTNAFYFKLERVYDAKITMTRKANDLQVLTLPYRTTGKPIGAVHSTDLINAYKVVGFEKDGDTGEVTDLKFAFLDAGEPTPSGTPIILETGSYGQYDPTSTDSITFDCLVDTTQLDLAVIDGTEVDATVGLQNTESVPVGNGRLFFRNALLYPINGSVTLTRQTGYINLNSIVDTSDEYSELEVIPVNGSIVGIGKTTIGAADEPVNVYTIDGVLVKKNVKAANATQGLSKGIYVVGKQKVLVK